MEMKYQRDQTLFARMDGFMKGGKMFKTSREW